jgi:hypothetical protein
MVSFVVYEYFSSPLPDSQAMADTTRIAIPIPLRMSRRGFFFPCVDPSTPRVVVISVSGVPGFFSKSTP